MFLKPCSWRQEDQSHAARCCTCWTGEHLSKQAAVNAAPKADITARTRAAQLVPHQCPAANQRRGLPVGACY
jgi:predicted DsbA family dithiol-disulfide isomerase